MGFWGFGENEGVKDGEGETEGDGGIRKSL